MARHETLREIKDSTFSPPTSREHMRVSGNPDVFKEAEAKHGTAELYGEDVQRKRAKRARGGKVVGSVTGKAVRQRLDRLGRKRGGVLGRTKRAEGGMVEPAPGADRSNYQEPTADYIGESMGNPVLRRMSLGEAKDIVANAAKKRGADILGLPGDVERPLNSAVDWAGSKLGYDPGFSRRPVFPASEDIQREWGTRKLGGRAGKSEHQAEIARLPHAASAGVKRGGRVSRNRNG
jgi:hypothetical protein